MNRIILTSALALAAIAGAAHAQPAGMYGAPPVTQAVHYADLDPTTANGAQRLAFRLRIAAQVVCGGNLRDVRTGVGFNDCVSSTLESAATKLNAPLVTEALGVTPGPRAFAHR